MVLFPCNYKLSMSNCYHKVSNIPFGSFLTSFSRKSKIKSLSRYSLDHSSWSSGLVKVVSFTYKTYSIQVESYQKFFQSKVCGQFSTTFSSKYQPQFQVILLQNSFTLTKSPFQASLWQNSAELSSCIWIVQYVLQHIKFVIPFCKCWVCFKTFLFEDRGCSLIIPS